MKITHSLSVIFLLTLLLVALPISAFAHCDTIDGPVVMDAKTAIAKGDATPVLKWVTAADEPQIRQALAQTLKVRGLSEDARNLADMYFFETVVRIHRASENAPYTGVKPAGTYVNPGIVAADKSLENGEVKPLLKTICADVTKGITTRFERAMELRRHKDDSVEQGREYVEAYVEYIHYVEGIVSAAHKTSAHTAETAEPGCACD